MKKYSMGSANISIVMRRELLDCLNDVAEKTGLTRNGIIITAIENFLKTNAVKEMAKREPIGR